SPASRPAASTWRTGTRRSSCTPRARSPRRSPMCAGSRRRRTTPTRRAATASPEPVDAWRRPPGSAAVPGAFPVPAPCRYDPASARPHGAVAREAGDGDRAGGGAQAEAVPVLRAGLGGGEQVADVRGAQRPPDTAGLGVRGDRVAAEHEREPVAGGEAELRVAVDGEQPPVDPDVDAGRIAGVVVPGGDEVVAVLHPADEHAVLGTAGLRERADAEHAHRVAPARRG